MEKEYEYFYVLEYLPCQSNTKEKCLDKTIREMVFDFKDGGKKSIANCLMCSALSKIINGDNKETVVCMIPASNKSKTISRYKTLVDFINSKNKKNITATLDAVKVISDSEPSHLNGKCSESKRNWKYDNKCYIGKHVILLDDVISSGSTFRQVANRMIEGGAISVRGLFLARSVNHNAEIYIYNGIIQNDELNQSQVVAKTANDGFDSLLKKESTANDDFDSLLQNASADINNSFWDELNRGE